MNMLPVALFCGLWYAITGWRPGYGTHSMFMEPLFCALPIGILMGNVPQAMILGAAIGMMYVGMIAPGSELPSDKALAGIVGVSIGLAINADPATAVLLAVPFGVFGTFLNTLRRLINGKFVHQADACAVKCDTKGIARNGILYPLIMNLVTKGPVAFIIVYFGADVAQALIEKFPAWVMHGMSVAGGVLPAIGFGLLLMIMGRPAIFPFFFLGFFFVKYFSLSTTAAVCFGLPIAIIIVLMMKESQDETLGKAQKLITVTSDDDDDEE